MATRPFAFGIRYRDKGRTVRVRQDPGAPKRYSVEVSQRGRSVRVAEHASLSDALRDFAAAWRARLH